MKCKKGINCEHILKAKICNSCWEANGIASNGHLSSGVKEELKCGNNENKIDSITLNHLLYCH